MEENNQRSHSNWEILQKLETRRSQLQAAAYLLTAGIASSTFIGSCLALGLLPSINAVLNKLQSTSRQVLFLREIVDTFGDEVTVHIDLHPPGLQPIDFFLAFPDKRFALVMLASRGRSRIVYNEKRDILQTRYAGGGVKEWKPDPMSQLQQQHLWISKERRDLKGGSSRDARRPVGKFLVLWGSTQLNYRHKDHLYSDMDGYRGLWIPRSFGKFCLVTGKEGVSAIQAYIADERSKSNKIQSKT